MRSKRWKSVEGEIARWFGSTRTPLSGGNSKHTRSDTLDKRFFVECKHGESSMLKTAFKMHKKGYCTILNSFDINLVMIQYSDLINDVNLQVKQEYQKVFAVGSLYIKTMDMAELESKVPMLILHLKGEPVISSIIITEAKYVLEIKEKLIFEWHKKVKRMAQRSLAFVTEEKDDTNG